MYQYIQTSLHSTLQSPTSIEVYNRYLEDPNVLQTIYFQIGNTSDFLIGAIQATEIPMPEPSEAVCSSNRLFASMKLRCTPEYSVGVSGRIISGKFADYSVADGHSSLVYDLGSFTPSVRSRVMALEFNIYNVNTGNVAIATVLIERSIHGNYVPSSHIVVVPPGFIYLGGTGSTLEWILVLGNIGIAAGSAIYLLYLLIMSVTRGVSSLGLSTLVNSSIAILCIVSASLQFHATFSTPMVKANLGLDHYVDLSSVASVFETVNVMNAIIIMLMFSSLIFAVIAPVSLEWVAATSVAVSVMVQLALVLQIRFPDLLTFRDAFMLLTKVGLRYVSASDFRFLSNFGIDMAIILILFTLVLFAFSGFVIGSFIANRMRGSKSLFDRFDRLVQGDDPPPQLHQEDPKPVTKDDATSNLDPEFMTSVEILAGRALTEIHDLRNEMDKQLEKAREDLVVASNRVKAIREKIIVS